MSLIVLKKKVDDVRQSSTAKKTEEIVLQKVTHEIRCFGKRREGCHSEINLIVVSIVRLALLLWMEEKNLDQCTFNNVCLRTDELFGLNRVLLGIFIAKST